jgi:predicted nucleotidyltransferase
LEKLVEQYLPEIKALMRKHGVESAYLFGSAAKGTMTEKSDIDFIIRFPESMHFTTYADNYFALADQLELLLKKKVELVTEKTLKNPYLLQVINQSKMRLI